MRKGFTLIEILVVLVIIGILIGLILPNTLKAIRQAQIKECASNLRSLNSAAQMCFTQERTWENCKDMDYLVANNYTEGNLVCPFGSTFTYKLVQEGTLYRANNDTHFAEWPNFKDHK